MGFLGYYASAGPAALGFQRAVVAHVPVPGAVDARPVDGGYGHWSNQVRADPSGERASARRGTCVRGLQSILGEVPIGVMFAYT
jgi:hypothetical protein